MFEVCYGVGVRWERRSKEMSDRRKKFYALKKMSTTLQNPKGVF